MSIQNSIAVTNYGCYRELIPRPSGAGSFICLLLVLLLVDQRGIEPPTSSVQTRRSSQLSYWPKKRETIIPRGPLDVKEDFGVKLCTFRGYVFWSLTRLRG